MALYDDCLKRVKDKDKYVTDFLNRAYLICQQMFDYDGLPDTIPSSQLERQLLHNGHVGVFKYKGKLYALSGNAVEHDCYGQPTTYQITNSELNYSETLVVGKNVVIVNCDTFGIGISPILEKYAALMCDTEISLNTVAVLSRVTMLLSAPDEQTRKAAEVFVSKILDGDFSVIAENSFLDGIKMHTPTAGSVQRITDIIELFQYYKASLYNEIGLQSNWNSKRETLTDGEVGMNVDTLLPLVDNMLKVRQNNVAAVNSHFGTDIRVDLNSAWRTLKESQERETEIVNTPSDNDETSDSNVESSQLEPISEDGGTSTGTTEEKTIDDNMEKKDETN